MNEYSKQVSQQTRIPGESAKRLTHPGSVKRAVKSSTQVRIGEMANKA